MTVYFPDTNFFLECRKASDLPWHELEAVKGIGKPDIRLIVPSTVITEIDRHKSKGNSRTARRARETSARLRQALTALPDHVAELSPANPRVILTLPPVVKVNFLQFPDLDPTRADHRIVAEYAELLKLEPNLILLTDDTLLTLAARSLGFEPVLIPEGWKLAPEKDERDDELERLKEELKSYKGASPNMVVAILDGNGGETRPLKANIEVFDPSHEEIEDTLALVQAHFPMADEFHRSPPASASPLFPALSMRKWKAPSDEAVEAYKSRHYPNWLELIRESLPVLVHQLNRISHEIPFLVRIANTGFANASNVRLTITACDGIQLLDSLSEEADEARRQELFLPSCPKPPCGGYVSIGFAMPSVSSDLARYLLPRLPPVSSRSPNVFYYSEGRPDPGSPVEDLELTCEAFPHQTDPYDLGFRIVIPQDTTLGNQPRIRVRLHASNLRKPIEQHSLVRVASGRGDFLQCMNEIMLKA